MTRHPVVLNLNGDAFTRGWQHGTAQRDAIHGFLADGLARLNAFRPMPPTLACYAPRLREDALSIERQTPDLWREIEGLAAGADICIEQAVLLQARRELAGYSRLTTLGDCTTFARAHGPAVLAQTIDLAADMDDQLCVLHSRDGATGRCSLLVSFTGLLGYLGLNDRGLAVGLNLVLGGTWRPGLPPYLAIRHVLDNAGTVMEGVALLRNLDLASSRAIMLCDASSVTVVEALDGAFRVLHGRELAHTNHFLAPDFAIRDEINVFAGNGSRRRLAACQTWLAAHPGAIAPSAVFDLFCSEPVMVPGTGDRRREKTVAAVVLQPETGHAHLRCGDPRVADTLHFTMPDRGERQPSLARAAS